jgi:hypothetical protein
MRKICTLITSKATDIDENIANQNHATPKPGYLNLSINKRRFEDLIHLQAYIDPLHMMS